MSPPVLFACHFTAKKEPDGQYDRLARVLRFTASQHCPDWNLQIVGTKPDIPAPATGNPSHAWNTSKLDWWADQVDACPDGARVVLMDADMFLMRPLDPLWALDFDLAYTIRDERTSRLPLNGGFVALRVSSETKAAMRRWQAVNDAMCRLGTNHADWHRKYAGMNQSSFGCVLEEGGFAELSVRQLRCQEWNCCEWSGYDQQTRVVHAKSRLRRAIFNASTVHEPHLRQLSDIWHALEVEAGRRRRIA